jgi:arsenate reductase
VAEKTYDGRFRCTGKSARSIVVEALLNSRGRHRFKASLPGSHKTGAVNPFALAMLGGKPLPTDGRAARTGANLPSLAPGHRTLYSPSATTQAANSVPFGLTRHAEWMLASPPHRRYAIGVPQEIEHIGAR